MIFRLARQTTTSRKSHYRECMGELCHVHRYMVLFCVCISLLRCGRRVVQCSPGMHLFFVRFRTEVYCFCGFPCRMRCNTYQTVNRQRAAFFFVRFIAAVADVCKIPCWTISPPCCVWRQYCISALFSFKSVKKRIAEKFAKNVQVMPSRTKDVPGCGIY